MESTRATADGVFPSTCWECSVCCGSLVTVADGRVTKVAPNAGHPHSKGAFCVKGIRRATGLNIVGGEDIANARTILIVGRNSYAADPVQWAALKQAKERGARIVVIDPKRIPACDLADLWLRPRPGADAAIALAMMQVM